MAHYCKRGNIISKRHIQFEKPEGGLYAEELLSTEGFSSIYSTIYHLYPPTKVTAIDDMIPFAPKIVQDKNLQSRCYKGFQMNSEDDYLKARKYLMVNNDVYIAVASPKKSMIDYFFKNSSADEMIFIHEGKGKLHTIYGTLSFDYGDYVIIPRGTIYQIEFETSENRLLIVESFTPIEFPKRYMNKYGQLLEHSPFCERDIKEPTFVPPVDKTGDFLVYIKRDDALFPYHYQTHPFDAIGWDGFLYPYIFSIHDFEPITGRVHQPPPVHQNFEAHNFVICSFCPRKYDYHPKAIPAPYHHANVDSDEVLYYVDGDFMSRKHVERGMFTLHPIGIPHGPHPGAIEKSIGKESTQELAVMIDCFKPLKICEDALSIEDKEYYKSWL